MRLSVMMKLSENDLDRCLHACAQVGFKLRALSQVRGADGRGAHSPPMLCTIMEQERSCAVPCGDFDHSCSLFFLLLPLSLFPLHVLHKDSQMSHIMKNKGESVNVDKVLSQENKMYTYYSPCHHFFIS